MFENPRRGRQARNFATNSPKILDLKSSSEQTFSRKLPLGAPEFIQRPLDRAPRDRRNLLPFEDVVGASFSKSIPTNYHTLGTTFTGC